MQRSEESPSLTAYVTQLPLFYVMNYTDGYLTFHVYIITNTSKTVLYTGVTNYLARRLWQHQQNIILKNTTFASRYKCKHLLYYQKFTWVQNAIMREKEIKGWTRVKKEYLIETINPDWNFLEYLFPYDPIH